MVTSVLVVDDDPFLLKIARASLERREGFRVEQALGGQEALALAGRSSFDLILLDAVMPDMDGLTVLRRLRGLAGHAHTPVVFLTAKSHPGELRGLAKAGPWARSASRLTR